MTHSCSNCTFTAQFESALKMHKQLHHDAKDSCTSLNKTTKLIAKKSSSRVFSLHPNTKTNEGKSLGRTLSASRLLDKLRARICRSRALFSHPEENLDDTTITAIDTEEADTLMKTECPTVLLAKPSISHRANVSKVLEEKETFGCHLCSFNADRITVLDRHLLNHHKIGLENLLKLVMYKTKDGLSEEGPHLSLYGITQPYYKPPDEILEEGEFIIETVTPKIKILKHAATNTEDVWSDLPDLKNNCKIITAELEKLMNCSFEKCDKDDFMVKMQTLNECMCKFVNSSNTLKLVLAKEFDSKHSVRKQLSSERTYFDLCLGDNRNTARVWDRSHSDTMDRSRNTSDKKMSSESFYF